MRVRGAAGIASAAVMLAACASRPKAAGPAATRPAPPPGAAAPRAAFVPPAIAPPVLRIGLASDLAEFTLPAPGAPWIVSGPAGTAAFAGPLTFRPVGGGSVLWIQTGAFSEESAARTEGDRMAKLSGFPSSVAFSADKGLYRVRIGPFADANAAAAARQKLEAAGVTGFPVSEASGSAGLVMRDASGREVPFSGGSADVAPGADGLFVESGGKKYRGDLRLVVNPRGTLNVVDVVNLEDYLRGVVPAEMGPRRFDELEALKAQAVAARTYAIDSENGFAAEGYDLCATPKCQVYAGVEAEDALSDLAVAQTRGQIATFQGKPIHALFTSTCGGATEDARLIFPGMAAPYLTGVVCGEQEKSMFDGARVPKDARGRSLSPLEWRGWVLGRIAAARGRRGRAAAWAEAFRLAGLKPRASAPASLSPAAVYPAVLAGFGLTDDRDVHLTKSDLDYAAGPPDPAALLPADARAAYDTLARMKVAEGAGLPPPNRTMSEAELDGLLFSVAMRVGGVVETTGRLARRDGGSFVVKTAAGRTSIPAETTVQVARMVGARFYPSSEVALTSGDAVGFWKRGAEVLAFWTVESPAGGTFEKESAWTEWVRRVGARELALRLAPRIAATEVVSIDVRKRGRSGRVVEAAVVTDKGSLTLTGFDVRQALQLPELLFTVEKAFGADGSPEFVFVGRGWGHGVGLCQNGAYGMALAGHPYDDILKHYYPGIEISPAAAAPAANAPAPSAAEKAVPPPPTAVAAPPPKAPVAPPPPR